MFYKVAEEKDKGRHVDVNVTAKGAIAPHPCHLDLQPSTNTDL